MKGLHLDFNCFPDKYYILNGHFRGLLSVKKILLAAVTALLVSVNYVVAEEGTTVRLDSCISYYMDGEYQKAADSIKALLPLISDRREEAEAYKYLGFSYVMLDLINKAKDFFRVALEKFPQMVIDTLEVPPNISIVFKQAKIESQLEKGEILDKSVQGKNTRRVVVSSVLTGAGALCAAAGGFFVYKGFKAHKDYKSAATPEDCDYFWNAMKKDYIVGGSAGGVALPALFFGIKMFLSKPAAQTDAPPPKAGINASGNSVSLTFRF